MVHNDSLTKAQLLNKYFTSVFTSSTAATFPPFNEPPLPDITTLSIDTRGVLTLLQNLQVHKASGPDEIPARFLKEFSEEFAALLTFLFQASIQQSLVPNMQILCQSLRKEIILSVQITDLYH